MKTDTTLTSFPGLSPRDADIARQIAEVMSQSPSGKAGQRFVHAKGIVCEGSFEPSPEAASVSRAAHLNGGAVPVVVRFSDAASNQAVSDTAPDATPRGLAIRFMTGAGTDVVALSHNGFVVGTGEDFLALAKAQAATDPSKPHPWPVEEFLGSHPLALKFVQEIQTVPASFAMETYFANNAFRFINGKGAVQAGRYQIVPVEPPRYLDEAAAKAKSPDFLREELKSRLAQGPVKFRLVLQLAAPGDRTDDGSTVWPDDRPKVDLGIITIQAVTANSTAAEKSLAFDSARLTDGIELSDDPLPALRSAVYSISAANRQKR